MTPAGGGGRGLWGGGGGGGGGGGLPAGGPPFTSTSTSPPATSCSAHAHGTSGKAQVAMIRSYGAWVGSPARPSPTARSGWCPRLSSRARAVSTSTGSTSTECTAASPSTWHIRAAL